MHILYHIMHIIHDYHGMTQTNEPIPHTIDSLLVYQI